MKKPTAFLSIALIAACITVLAWKPSQDISPANCSSAEAKQSQATFGVSVFDRFDAFSFPVKIEPRFMSTVTKEALHNARSLSDILGENYFGAHPASYAIRLTVLNDDYSESRSLAWSDLSINKEQQQFLNAVDHSDNLVFHIDFTDPSMHPSAAARHYTPHLTVVPHKQADYQGGTAELVDYLRLTCAMYTTAIHRDDVQDGKIFFTIEADGNVDDIRVVHSSGHAAIDSAFSSHLENAPGIWMPAENASGEKVDQELVLFIGSMGC